MTVSHNKSRPVRAVVYGVGEMGSIVTRLLVERGAEIVGAIARSETKVGRDLARIMHGHELSAAPSAVFV